VTGYEHEDIRASLGAFKDISKNFQSLFNVGCAVGDVPRIYTAIYLIAS
jgi:hypothetical protein